MCFRVWPNWGEARWRAVAQRVLALRPGVTFVAASRILEEGQVLQARLLKLDVPCPWPGRVRTGPDAPAVGAEQAVRPFVFLCMAGCQVQHSVSARPAGAGGWPHWGCDICKRKFRLGRARCALCLQVLRVCGCGPGEGQAGRQSTLEAFFRPGPGPQADAPEAPPVQAQMHDAQHSQRGGMRAWRCVSADTLHMVEGDPADPAFKRKR
eukprot:5260252-Alexandrium_andersonii.AAC.1